jgi:hypothetical protein
MAGSSRSYDPVLGDHRREPGRLPACGSSYLTLKSSAAPARQLCGLLIVAITAYWQHVVVDDRACLVVTW